MASEDRESRTQRGWTTARGNFWEWTVQTELESELGARGIELPQAVIDDLAWALAVDLDYKWRVEPKVQIPVEFEPEPDR